MLGIFELVIRFFFVLFRWLVRLFHFVHVLYACVHTYPPTPLPTYIFKEKVQFNSNLFHSSHFFSLSHPFPNLFLIFKF